MPNSKKTADNTRKRPPWSGPIQYPDSLPISAKVEEIKGALENHQIVIVAGETGSGKTTQLPKICLDLGYGEQGQIAHTQPRRIAARTVADRIATELGTELGDGVGFQIRFTDQSSANTRIRLMTDGVLLSEFQFDPLLKRYDVIIIDEAHERSLNIDFLLGLLKPLCRKRPELKLIITSATIDVEKFAQHFANRKQKAAPIIEVSGRTYPVETIYQPPGDEQSSLPEVVTQTVKDIIRGEAKGEFSARGDILVFCPGEREIRECAQSLRQAHLSIQVLPLYSRLSIAEQNKVFQPSQKRKVVLATNVAETSLTVPGIAFVIDPGLARISRYSFRSKIQRLPVEPISQASANQRQGRSGRIANGVCIRLYSQEDFSQRPEFTPAEILRSNLASVVLRMLRLGIKDVSKFDFIDQPDTRLLNDAFKLLVELGAVDNNKRLTNVGRRMSDLPVDPKYARILIAANEMGCLRDALVVVSALSIQDPRERPVEHQQKADETHRTLHHPQSDFFSYLFLWQAVNNARDQLSNAAFKRHCLTHYWSIPRIFEWRELTRQLLIQCKRLGLSVTPWEDLALPSAEKSTKDKKQAFSSRYQQLHQALIPGLVSHVAQKDTSDGIYSATRGREINLFPGSAVHKQQPKWIIAAEFLETSRLFAHTVGEIQPNWVINAAQHLCRYTTSAPYYDARSGKVVAYRKTLLYGLTLRAREKVHYEPLNAEESHAIFIQQALVEGRYQPRGKVAEFVHHNSNLMADIEKLETKTRRRNLLVDDSAINRYYAERLPAHVSSRSALEKWLRQGNDDILKLDRETLLQAMPDANHEEQFPDHLEVLGKKVTLEYKFNPGRRSDGVTMTIPVSVLAPFPDHIGDWLVPGLLREKCVALIKTLPKPIRRNFAPAADAIDRIANRLTASDKPLTAALADLLYHTRGVKVTAADFAPAKLDSFYHMNYRIIDVDGSLIEEGRDLSSLKQSYAHAVKQSIHASNAPERLALEQHQITDWNFGTLDSQISYQHQGMTVNAYPMLKRRQDGSISLLMHDDKRVADYHSHHGIIELAKTVLANTTQKQSLAYLRKELMRTSSRGQSKREGLSQLGQKLKQATTSSSDHSQWIERVINASLLHCCFGGNVKAVRNQSTFSKGLSQGGKDWVKTATELESLLRKALDGRDSLLAKINAMPIHDVQQDQVLEDIKAQLYRLFEPSFLSYTSPNDLRQLPRYLNAIEARLEKLEYNIESAKNEPALSELQTKLDEKVEVLKEPELEFDFVFLSYPELSEFKIMLEEWRVSLFAQHLKANMKVSEKRLKSFWSALDF